MCEMRHWRVLYFCILSSILTIDKAYANKENLCIPLHLEEECSKIPPLFVPIGIDELPNSISLESKALLKMISDQSRFSIKERRAAFKTFCRMQPKTEPHFIPYCKPEEINLIQEVPSHIYAEIVKSMTISCVDIFVYNFEDKAYLMIQRTSLPVKGNWWMPGGRIFKGESFYESAIRKTKKESGLDICPIAQLGTYTTYFLESAWGSDVHTDTKNTVILALCDHQNTSFDEHHQDFKWVSINEPPTDPYLLNAYQEAKEKLLLMGFLD